MPAVFVHGVPETTAVWEPLVAHLRRDDVVLLELPGFGCPLPDGFEPTMEAYAQWLATMLAPLGDVDLVGHDWGALLALRVLPDRPVRSWALDAGDLDEGFRWHDMARTWQSPEGDEFMRRMVDAPARERAALLEGAGVPEDHALGMAEAFDATMGSAILSLYRSATDIGTEWGPGIDRITGRGLLVESMQDPYRAPGRVRSLAQRTGAHTAPLPDAGHWWMLESPELSARILEAFWQSAGSGPR